MHDWIPLIRVGPFEFNQPVEPLVNQGTLVKLSGDVDNIGWETYGIPGDSIRVSVDIESGRIISVECYDECVLNETNVIGIEFDDFKKLLGEDPQPNPDTFEIDEEPQLVYEFDDSDAQVWVKENKVVAVICSAFTEEEIS